MINNPEKYDIIDVSQAVRTSPNNASIGYKLLVLITATIYGGILASLPLHVFSDRPNYFEIIKHPLAYLESYANMSPVSIITNEPLWFLVNAGLASVLSPELGLRVIIFVPATVVAWAVLRRDSQQFFWLLFFLLIPAVISYHIAGLRQGLATALFLTGWFSPHRSLRWVLMLAAPFVHSAFLFLLALLAVTNLAKRLRLSASLRTFLWIGTGISLGVSIPFLSILLGTRQGTQYVFEPPNTTGLGFVFWIVVLGIMSLEGRRFMRRYTFELGLITFYLTTYFWLVFTARIFEAGLLLILIAGLNLTSWRRTVFLTIIVCYSLLIWVPRFNEPWMGFGF